MIYIHMNKLHISILALLVVSISFLVYAIVSKSGKSKSNNHKAKNDHEIPTRVVGVQVRPVYFRFNKQQNNVTTLPLIRVFEEVLKNRDGTFASTVKEANLIFFDNLTYIDRYIRHYLKSFPTESMYIYGVMGSDHVAGKDLIYKLLRKTMDSHNLTKHIPKTFLLPSEINKLIAEHKHNNIYIIKKNLQRQQGNLITNDISLIQKNANDYVVCQELLQNPLIFQKRKINLRFYLLIVVTDDNVGLYLYHNGFIYYTPEYFEKGSIDPHKNITTGYIDRRVYTENPMTFEELATVLGPSYNSIFANTIHMFRAFKPTFKSLFRSSNPPNKSTCFMIMGCDVAPDEDFNVKLMEINKGPDLSYKDDRDKRVKYTMISDMMSLVFHGIGTKHKQTSGFIYI